MATDLVYGDRLGETVTELVDAFEKNGASYALIGGIAIGVRSRPRTTKDVDILLSVPQLRLPGLVADLAARGFTLDEQTVIEQFGRHHITAFNYHGVRVDWLKPVLPTYQHILDRAVREERPFDRPVRIATAEGLILLKLVASRPQDVADVGTLLASNQGVLDLNWIEREWLTMFPTADPRWQHFRKLVTEFYERPSAAS
jgi:hypothetical protein